MLFLIKQSWSKILQVIAPCTPTMARLVRLAILILDAILVEDLVGVRTTAIGHVRRSALSVGKQLKALVNLGSILLEVSSSRAV